MIRTSGKNKNFRKESLAFCLFIVYDVFRLIPVDRNTEGVAFVSEIFEVAFL